LLLLALCCAVGVVCLLIFALKVIYQQCTDSDCRVRGRRKIGARASLLGDKCNEVGGGPHSHHDHLLAHYLLKIN
jgi:hypothetical protein